MEMIEVHIYIFENILNAVYSPDNHGTQYKNHSSTFLVIFLFCLTISVIFYTLSAGDIF